MIFWSPQKQGQVSAYGCWTVWHTTQQKRFLNGDGTTARLCTAGESHINFTAPKHKNKELIHDLQSTSFDPSHSSLVTQAQLAVRKG